MIERCMGMALLGVLWAAACDSGEPAGSADPAQPAMEAEPSEPMPDQGGPDDPAQSGPDQTGSPPQGQDGGGDASAWSPSGAADAALDAALDGGSDSGRPSGDAAADAGRAQGDGPCQSSDGGYGHPLPADVAQRVAEPLRTGFDFLEGPVWHAEQAALFFSDMDMSDVDDDGVASRIHRFAPPDGLTVFVADSGSNGLALDAQGRLLAATHDAQTLSLFDASSAQRTTLDLAYMGKRFNSPNDLAIREDGNIYFTDPDWQLPPRSSETEMTGVYRVAPDMTVSLVDGTLNKPNGIALSPDQQTLYVGSAGSDIHAYAVDQAGVPSQRRVFATTGASDGLGIDCAGNLYVTAAGSVIVFDPTGSELGRIQVAESPANVAFGSADRQTLYITARTRLYSIHLQVPGYPY